MLSGVFAWIRTRVREAFVAGIQDGLSVLDGKSQQPQLDLPEAIRERLLPALPEAEIEESNGKKRRVAS